MTLSSQSARTRSLRKRTGGFALLEVLVSLVILGITVAAVMQSFTISVQAIRKNDRVTIACMLAETLIQDLNVQPPTTRFINGNFESMGHADFSYEVETREEEPNSRDLGARASIEGLRPLVLCRLKLRHTDKMGRPSDVLDTTFLLMPLERFSPDAKLWNGIFLDEAGEK
jgi:prepilin-type N-terminal cleavage/methylation domain-containing protein